MMGMIPLIILLLVIAGIVMIPTKVMKRSVKRKGKMSYSQRVWWIFSGYVVVLLICLVLTNVLPVKINEWKQVKMEDVQKEGTDLYERAVNGKLNQEDKKFIRKKWEFPLTENELNINFQDDEKSNTTIVVERNNTNNGKIEAVFYRTRSSVNGIDITKWADPIDLVQTEGKLTIVNPKVNKIAISQFTNTFPVSQFTGEPSMFEHGSEFSGGASILYLYIPKDLKLLDQSNLNLQFVE